MKEAALFLGPESAAKFDFMKAGYDPDTDESNLSTLFDDVKDVFKKVGSVFNPISSAQAGELSKSAKAAPESPITKAVSSTFISRIIPQHARFLFNYVTGNHGPITEADVTPEVQQVLKTAVANAKKAGRSWVSYDDYPNLANGISARELATWGSNKKQAARYTKNVGGVMNIIMDSFDPVMAASMSMGKFSFHEREGKLIITDQYDLVTSKSKTDDLFSIIRDMAPGGLGSIPIKLTINQ